MRRFFRFIGFSLAGLVALVFLAIIGLYLMSEISRLPHDHRTTWLDGPGEDRIRCVSWREGGNWMDEAWEIHEYTHVSASGKKTLIGRGTAALDSDDVHLYSDGDQAELVVEDDVFHRTPKGKWTLFRAVDRDFIHLHYSPVPGGGSMERTERSWRYGARPSPCRISALDLQRQRMDSECGWGGELKFVFRRDSYDAPWVLDPEATFAKMPPPERSPFPEFVRATLTAVRVTPAEGDARLPSDVDPLQVVLDKPSVEMIARREFEIVNGEPIELPLAAEPISRKSFSLTGAWLDENGWPVVLWSEHPEFKHHGKLRAQAFGAAVRVWAEAVRDEDTYYIVYLQFDPR